jgi:ribonucleoside-diphosphate reductase alpha chain
MMTTNHKSMPDERTAITHKFTVGGHKGYVTAGLYKEGGVGEVFIVMSKTGSSMAGLLDCFSIAVSTGLQHGVPLKRFVDKFKTQRFEPAGFTGHPEIKQATSVVDYVFQWLELRFLEEEANDKV